MLIPGRHEASGSYRYGFNGMEKDDEISGGGNSYTAEFWEYDSRLGKRWNIDPMFLKYSWQSPNCTFNNNPIYFSDPNGLEGGPKTHKVEKGDTYASVAQKYNVSVEDLQKWNKWEDTKIPIGANMIISNTVEKYTSNSKLKEKYAKQISKEKDNTNIVNKVLYKKEKEIVKNTQSFEIGMLQFQV